MPRISRCLNEFGPVLVGATELCHVPIEERGWTKCVARSDVPHYSNSESRQLADLLRQHSRHPVLHNFVALDACGSRASRHMHVLAHPFYLLVESL
eukprot:113183-Pelagomonas_calceolata.AAC.4